MGYGELSMKHVLEHPEARQFIAALGTGGDDPTHAARLADWLEENGAPAHAEVIRLHQHYWRNMFQNGERIDYPLPPLTGAAGYEKFQAPYTDWQEHTKAGHPHTIALFLQGTMHKPFDHLEPTFRIDGGRAFNVTLPKKQADSLASALDSEGTHHI